MVQPVAAAGPREKTKRNVLTFRDRVDAALREALYLHMDSAARWDKLIADGANDNQIWHALHVEFGPAGGASQTEQGVTFAYLGNMNTGSVPPKFWLDSAAPHRADSTTKPTLAGAALVKRVRELLAIPPPKGDGHDKDATVTKADIAEAEQLIGGEKLDGARLFVRVSGLLRNAKNLTELNEVIEGNALNDVIDGAQDSRFTPTQASKLKFMVEATAKQLSPAAATSPTTQPTAKGAKTMAAGATKAKAKAQDLPGMEDRRDREVHDLAERYVNLKIGMREQKTEMDDLARRIAQILHRRKKNVYRCDGLVITLEEVEKVKITTGKSDDED